jgi:hypothetical protein
VSVVSKERSEASIEDLFAQMGRSANEEATIENDDEDDYSLGEDGPPMKASS